MFRPGPARRLHVIRIKALLLLGVFLSAGTSLPSLDALTYHQDAGESGKSQPHIEPAGGCLSHSDQCSLGRSASGSSAFGALPGVARMELECRPVLQRIPRLQPTCADLSAVPQPRAPPAFRSV